MVALGIAGIYLEFVMPGWIAPGVIGAVLIALGAFSLASHPINANGALLILLALGLLALEIKHAAHGLLAIGAVIALSIGAMKLIAAPDGIHPWAAAGVSVPLVLISLFLARLASKARHNKIATGIATMIGLEGVALEDLSPDGRVLVRGEYWQARADTRIPRGAHVKISGVANLRVCVEPVKEQST